MVKKLSMPSNSTADEKNIRTNSSPLWNETVIPITLPPTQKIMAFLCYSSVHMLLDCGVAASQAASEADNCCISLHARCSFTKGEKIYVVMHRDRPISTPSTFSSLDSLRPPGLSISFASYRMKQRLALPRVSGSLCPLAPSMSLGASSSTSSNVTLPHLNNITLHFDLRQCGKRFHLWSDK